MTQLVIDAVLQSKLEKLTEPAELCDSSGRVLGRFVPAYLEPQLSEEELQRRAQEPEFTTAEVLAHLGNL
jgi:hypothetical protein